MSWPLDVYDIPEYYGNEEHWKEGFHVTEEEKRIELSDMTIGHLRNTIKCFEKSDTTPLEKELKRRLINNK